MQEIFKDLGMVINGILFLSPKEAYEATGRGAILVDIREEYETVYKIFDVKKVFYKPFSRHKGKMHQLPEDEFLIIADSAGNKLRQVISGMTGQGYTKIAGLNGGIFDWERDGLPMKFDRGESLTGSCACTLKPKKRFRKKKQNGRITPPASK
jgi:rhodanese-related sulfurtransferase